MCIRDRRYTYKEATFRGLHCVRGCLLLDGKLLYKGVFAPPAEGMLSVPQGNGELHSPDGSIYYGEIDNVVPHGRGCLVSNSGTEAIYTDWIAGDSTESTDTMRKILLRGDRPVGLFDGDRIVCPVSGAPLTFYYIGSPRLTLCDESGATLTCPDTEEWNYRFGSPTDQPEPKPKPTAEPGKRTNPTAQPRPAQASGERKETRQPANEEKKQELTQKEGKNGKFGFVDERGHWVIQPQFEDAWSFTEGLAPVKTNGKWGFIDKRGNFAIQPRFEDWKFFNNGKAQVKQNGEWFYIDKQGNRIGERKETSQPANMTEESRLFTKTDSNKKWGFVNLQNHWIIPAQFDHVFRFTEGLAAVQVDGKWGFIDKRGKFVIPLQFTRAGWFAEGLAPVKTNDKYGFIDKRGDFVIAPRFDYALEFGYGLAPVMMNDKWGFINQQGRIIIPIQYDDADPFIQGKAEVELNGEIFYINQQGNRLP